MQFQSNARFHSSQQRILILSNRARFRPLKIFHSLKFNDFLRGEKRIEKQLKNIKFQKMCIGPEITEGEKGHKNSERKQKSFVFV